MIDIILRKI